MNNTAFIPTPPTSSSLWERLSTWASENKATVYTIAGVTLVVTAAGVYYYSSEAAPVTKSSPKKKAKKRKNKKDPDQAKQPEAPTQAGAEKPAPSVASADLSLDADELTEEVIASLSENVCPPSYAHSL